MKDVSQKTRAALLWFICGIFLLPGALLLFTTKSALLAGEKRSLKPVRVNLDNWVSQKLQHYVEEKLKRSSVVFDLLVKSDNQLSYELFNSISSNPQSSVVLGEKGHLIERLYIKDANRVTPWRRPEMMKAAQLLKDLQEHLRAKGIEFVLVISPNKPSFYPDIIPARYRIAGAESRFNARAFMTKELARLGVRFIDGFEFLKRKEEQLQVSMFSPVGTHWNEVGGCLIASEILRQTKDVQGEERPQFECVVDGVHPQPGYHDSELLRIANLLDARDFAVPAPRVAIRPVSSEKARPINLLMVGSSFCWELMRQFENSKAIAIQEFLYYFHRKSRHSTKRGFNFDHNSYRPDKELKRRDIVVIEINQSVLWRAGFGFPEAVLGADRNS